MKELVNAGQHMVLLSLYLSKIGDAGARILAEHLAANAPLAEIDLTATDIGPDGTFQRACYEHHTQISEA